MDIIARKREFLQSVSSHIPRKLSDLFAFGCDALVGQTVVSLRANARLTRHGWFTAKSKAWRLTTNARMVGVFHALFTRVCPVAASDIVAIDFSDFKNGREVLLFAKQTNDGRACPLFFDLLEYPVEEGSQNLFIVASIKRFLELSGCVPTLVFDRGFAVPHLIGFLARNKIPFIIRIKKRKLLSVVGGTRVAAEAIERDDERVREWGCDLRLIRSDDPGNGNEPWYLITNDTESQRDEIIRRYYRRFEIEEFFRDAERLLGLEQHQMKSARSLSILLWFVILGTWFFRFCAAALTASQERERESWRVSRVRYIWEIMRRDAWRGLEQAASALPGPQKTV